MAECTICKQTVGISPDWNRRQVGRLIDYWKVARHRVRESGNRKIKDASIPMCVGSGMVVPSPELEVSA